jgi:fructose-bisphosphate aldolase class II
MRDRSAQLDLGLIGELAASVPVPLVLHGSSGVADEVIAAAVAAGIRKVNVGTALNIAYTAALRDALAAHPDAVDPRRYTRDARTEMAGLVSGFCAVVDGGRLAA